MTMKKLSCSSGLTGHLVPVKAYAQTRQRLRFSHTQSMDVDEGLAYMYIRSLVQLEM